MRELTEREQDTLEFLGNFHPTVTVQDRMVKGYMADDEGVGKVYLSSQDLRKMAEDLESVAEWLDWRAYLAEHLGPGER
jgi:hypothetical protein